MRMRWHRGWIVFVLSLCASARAFAAVASGADADLAEARFMREFEAVSYADEYLLRIVNLLASKAPTRVTQTFHVRVARLSMPFAFYLSNGAVIVSTGLLARMQNDSQVAAMIAPEMTNGLVPPVAGSVDPNARLMNDRNAMVWLDNAGFDPRQAPQAAKRLLDTLRAEQAFTKSRQSNEELLTERISQLTRALNSYSRAPTSRPPANEVAEPIRSLARRASIEIANDYVEHTKPESFRAVVDRIEREYGASAETSCLRARHLREQSNALHVAPDVIQAYQACVAMPDAPAENFEALAFLYRDQGRSADAVRAFQDYLRRFPNEPDAPLIPLYIGELREKH